jgi:hypothetical protein
MVEVVEHLPSKCEALSSNSSTVNQKKKENLTYLVWIGAVTRNCRINLKTPGLLRNTNTNK